MRSKGRMPTPHDRYIGERIREARIAAEISQEDLADMIGTSYQQVQKYESGRNRVNGARFDRLCTALNRPLSYFFPAADNVRNVPALSAFLASKEAQRIAEAWPRLSPRWQAWVVSTIDLIAKERP